MKKLLVSTLLAVFVLSFSACGGENEELNSGNGAVNQTQDDMQTKEEQRMTYRTRARMKQMAWFQRKH